MTELKSLDQVSLVLAFLVPGLVILWMRAQFLTGRIPPHKDALLSYLALSVLYHGLVWPLVGPRLAAEAWWAWMAYAFVGPASVGALLGWLATAPRHKRWLSALRINLVHPMPTAWDYCFGLRATAGLVEVLMKDGSKVYGWLAPEDSFASSVGKDNDLLIGNVFVQNEEGNLVPAEPRRAIYIAPGEIRSITFFSVSMEG